MDAGFVREGIPPDDRFVRLRTEADDRTQDLARREQVLGVDARLVWIPVVARLHHHHDLFERAVARAFADTVNSAFDLPRSGLHRSQRIGYRETQIVVAMYA